MNNRLPISAALLLFAATGWSSEDRCIAPREFVPFPAGTPGQYHRVSPDGNFVIQSFSSEGFGDVSIVDLRRDPATGKRPGRIYKTPMANETYPVEGTWRYIASPGRWIRAMEYFRMEDLLRDQDKTQFFFSGSFGEFYHTCAELPGSTAENVKFRIMGWTKLAYVDYDVKLNPNGSLNGEPKSTSSKWLCQNIASKEGFELVQPILSKDGTELAGIPQNARNPSMRIYKILENGDCERVLDLGFQTAKISFGFAVPGKKGRVTFTNADDIYIHDRDEGLTFAVGDRHRETGYSYPGLTRDGRVIYLVSRDGQMGYSIVDPYQIRPSAGKKCITESEVAAVEKQQAAIWKLSR